jgi:hypothetical protein
LSRQLVELAVYPHPRVAVLGEFLEEPAVLALPPPHDRREHQKARPLRQLHDLLDHLLRRRGGDGEAADVAVGPPGAGVKEAEVVVDLRDGRDRRARVVARRLLVDRDGRGEAVYVVHIGLVHLP